MRGVVCGRGLFRKDGLRMNQVKNIAIDGPAGAGKSTIARMVSQRLGFLYVDTGALYRSIGVCALRNGVKTDDANGVEALLPRVKVELKFVDGVQHVFLNGDDVSEEIRKPEASMAASNVSAIPAVRAFLFDLQREMAAQNNVVMDGRDIGTVVLPDADLKIFLTASPEERARRRFNEMKDKGMDVEFGPLLEEIKQRDYNDSHRAIAPLKQAQDAVLVDTTENTLEESIARVEALARERLGL